jgi:hypothetical protein
VVQAGDERLWRGRIRLRRGRYLLVARATDASGRREASAKAGWLGASTLASEAARLERGRVRVGIAVFTDHNPAGDYGKETVAGVTARLLGR